MRGTIFTPPDAKGSLHLHLQPKIIGFMVHSSHAQQTIRTERDSDAIMQNQFLQGEV